jgi:hypothetical protein
MVRLADSHTTVFVCDAVGCDAQQTVLDPIPGDLENGLELPWRAFSLPGWVGRFHACSDAHEQSVRDYYERP